MSVESSVPAHDGVRRVRPRVVSRAVAAATLCAIALTGCSDLAGGGKESAPTASGASSDSPVASTPASTAQADGRATPPGTRLQLGDPAVVRFAANPKQDSLIRLSVTNVKQGKIKDLSQFRLDDQTKRSSVYYVSATVKNVGKGDLGGQPVSLYGQVSADLVVPPVIFGSTFQRCDYQPLPDKFGRGERADVCIAFLAPRHGKVFSVQWRPADNSDPITWTVR